MITTRTQYVAEDGKEFDTLAEAEKYEKDKLGEAEKRYLHFTRTAYSGRMLLKNYTLDDYGVWRVRGEDDNCDLGGFHHMPTLGYFEGTLEQVIRKAVSLERFYTWGGGGDIDSIELETVEKL